MRYHGILTLALAVALTVGLPAGCAAPGSKEAQVAGWQRQVKRNPDARVNRHFEQDASRGAGVAALIAAGVAASLTFGILGGISFR